MPTGAADWFSLLAMAASAAAAAAAIGHALIHKRDPRSATLWLLLIVLLPVGGAVLYVFFGINRVQRRARKLRGHGARGPASGAPDPASAAVGFAGLATLVARATQLPLTTGNRIAPLDGGHAAYPAMLEAIDRARTSVVLASYIFDAAGIGAAFIDALHRAQRRGVAVRVLIDDVYVRLSRGSAYPVLRAKGVPVASFNPPIIPARLHAANLRNHRKLLIVDGRLGFTGGMNIHTPYWNPEDPGRARRDLHFRVQGPVVGHLADAFARDWLDTTGEPLGPAFWGSPPAPLPAATSLARGIEAGPDEAIDRVRWTFLGAIAAARHSVRIWTPYFVPDQALLSALATAALRGVAVEVLTPQNGDHPFVQWAARAHYWQILEHGARIFERSGPFDHTKLMLVDDEWVCLGSANWDARSLRLNFEFNVEVYDPGLAAVLAQHFVSARDEARRITLDDVDRRPLAIKLRDGFARLFAPVL
jgi:cardiolipin synthase